MMMGSLPWPHDDSRRRRVRRHAAGVTPKRIFARRRADQRRCLADVRAAVTELVFDTTALLQLPHYDESVTMMLACVVSRMIGALGRRRSCQRFFCYRPKVEAPPVEHGAGQTPLPLSPASQVLKCSPRHHHHHDADGQSRNIT